MLRVSLRYGLFAGLVMSVLSVIFWSGVIDLSAGAQQLAGYGIILLSCCIIYSGIKFIREKVQGGILHFSDALLYGCLMAAIAAIVYAAVNTFFITYIQPDYMQQYYGELINQVQNSGRSEASKKTAIEYYQRQLDNYTPMFNFFLMFGTVITVGVIVTLFSARILKRETATSRKQSIQ